MRACVRRSPRRSREPTPTGPRVADPLAWSLLEWFAPICQDNALPNRAQAHGVGVAGARVCGRPSLIRPFWNESFTLLLPCPSSAAGPELSGGTEARMLPHRHRWPRRPVERHLRTIREIRSRSLRSDSQRTRYRLRPSAMANTCSEVKTGAPQKRRKSCRFSINYGTDGGTSDCAMTNVGELPRLDM